MEVSILAAKLFAAVYIVFGLGFVLSGDYYKKVMDELFDNSGFKFLGGLMALIVGILLVMYHNVWEGGWPIVVTVLGWLALLKGVLLIVFPNCLDFFRSTLAKVNMNLLGFVMLVVGLLFGYAGFGF